MNVLVTAGNTQTPIDKVRCLTNVFTGKTGASIAHEAHRRGHSVRLLTSHPETAPDLDVVSYRTFDDLHRLLERQVPASVFDAIVHCAAVSDYALGGVFSKDSQTGAWIDRSAGKIKSDEPELWLKLVRTPKLVDLFRDLWGFHGMLIKFKLEVEKTEDELREIAERSRRQSRADYMVANTLEGAGDWALVGGGEYHRIDRSALAGWVVDRIEERRT